MPGAPLPLRLPEAAGRIGVPSVEQLLPAGRRAVVHHHFLPSLNLNRSSPTPASQPAVPVDVRCALLSV